MKKYVANICEGVNIEIGLEQYLKLQNKTVEYGGEEIACRAIIAENNKGKEYFVLYPVREFEVKDE